MPGGRLELYPSSARESFFRTDSGRVTLETRLVGAARAGVVRPRAKDKGLVNASLVNSSAVTRKPKFG